MLINVFKNSKVLENLPVLKVLIIYVTTYKNNLTNSKIINFEGKNLGTI